MAAFAGVRVESAHYDARRGDAEARTQVVMQYPYDGVETRRGDRVGDFAQRQMGGDERHSQSLGEQHHHHPRVPVISARNSVWPEKAKPAALMMPLCTGPVTSAANSPRKQPSVARRSVAST